MGQVNQHISQLREDFMKGELSENNLNKTPDLQFEQWMKDAIDAKVNEVPACNLATVDKTINHQHALFIYVNFLTTNFIFIPIMIRVKEFK
jgi:pyridoxamine 5'-phosphate oxidase